MMVLRWPEHTFLKMEVLPAPEHHFSEPKGVRFRGGGVCLSVWVFTCSRKSVPAPRRERIFENGQRDLGVSSKAHKFACELRALLASDKHLGSAERSERQLPTPNTPASARGTVADLPATPLPPTQRDTLPALRSAVESFGAWVDHGRHVCAEFDSI